MKMVFTLLLACVGVIAAHPTDVNLTSDGVSEFSVPFIPKQLLAGALYKGV